MTAGRLLAHYEKIADAPDAVPRLRRFILDLAVHGKLVEQDPNDEPASELLKRIAAEKAQLVKAGKVRKTKRSWSIDDDSLLFESPPGWMWSRLGGISRKIHYGFTASADQGIDTVRLLRITDIQNNRVEWDSVPGCEIDDQTLPNFELETGDILIARTGGTIGKSFLVTGLPLVAVFASYLIRVQGSKEIYTRYLKLFLESPIYWTQLQEGARGAGQPNVNGQTLGKMQVPIPPVEEQHRIVAKVDELMALCDRLETARTERETTRDRLAAASLARLNEPDPDPAVFQNHAAFALDNLIPLTTRPDQIKALRQTILNLAVRGKLVEQDPNDEPASELLKRIAEEKKRLLKSGKIRKPKSVESVSPNELVFELPSGWAAAKFSDVLIELQTGPFGSSLHQSDYEIGGTPVINPASMQDGKIVPIEKMAVGDKTLERLVTFKLQAGDIVMGRRGEMGRCAVVTEQEDGWLCGTGSLILHLSDSLYPKYLAMFIGSPYVREYLGGFAVGSTMQNLNQSILLKMSIGLPPLAEQRRIVTKVDELMALCDRLDTSLASGDDTRRRLLDALMHEAL